LLKRPRIAVWLCQYQAIYDVTIGIFRFNVDLILLPVPKSRLLLRIQWISSAIIRQFYKIYQCWNEASMGCTFYL